MTRLQAHSRATAYSRAPRTDYRPYIAVAALLALFLTASHFAPPVNYSVRPGPSHTSHRSNYDLDVLATVAPVRLNSPSVYGGGVGGGRKRTTTNNVRSRQTTDRRP